MQQRHIKERSERNKLERDEKVRSHLVGGGLAGVMDVLVVSEVTQL